MKIIIDEREIALYNKCITYLSTQHSLADIQISKEVLPLGDILIKTNSGKDVLLIERKSFSDLLSSIKDSRYEEQSYRLVNSSGFHLHSIIYLVEGMFSQLRTPMETKIIYSAMTSLQFFKGFSVHRTSSVTETAEWLILTADKIERDLAKGKVPYYFTEPYLKNIENRRRNVAVSEVAEPEIVALAKFSREVCEGDLPEDTISGSGSNQSVVPVVENSISLTAANYCTVVKKVKKDNITPENIGEIILCQIPGISSVTAIAIMKKFTNFPTLMDELNKNPQCLDNFACETNGKSRKISKTCIDSIRRFLLHKPEADQLNSVL